jgi:hypothetical protein
MPTSETSKKFLKCCLTDHNVDVEPDFSDKLRYLGYAKETSPTTGKLHWQGFAKEGMLIEHCLPPRQEVRTDLQELKFQLDAGRQPMEIADEIDGMFSVVALTERFSVWDFTSEWSLCYDHTSRIPSSVYW